jgi:hypothetical protein
MLANSVELAVAYLMLGLVLTCVGRGGRAEDWDETLLASLLGPPLFTLIAGAVLACFLSRALLRGDRPADLVSHSHRKRLTDHRFAGAPDRPGLKPDPGCPSSQCG